MRNQISAASILDEYGGILSIASKVNLVCQIKGVKDRAKSWYLSLFSVSATSAKSFVQAQGQRLKDRIIALRSSVLVRNCSPNLRQLSILVFALLPAIGFAADIDRFVGTYQGEAEFVFEGTTDHRDMSTTIAPTDHGFSVTWTSVTHKSDGRSTEKTYTIEFGPSSRSNIYGSEMKINLFGKATPLNPLLGDPYVWARVNGDTFSLFSLFINEAGDYEVQEYHRSLAEGGLDLVFRRIIHGHPDKEVKAFLKRVE